MRKFTAKRRKRAIYILSIPLALMIYYFFKLLPELDSTSLSFDFAIGFLFFFFLFLFLSYLLYGYIKATRKPALIFDEIGVHSVLDTDFLHSFRWPEIKSFRIGTRESDSGFIKESYIALSIKGVDVDEKGKEIVYSAYSEIINTSRLDKTPVEIMEAFRYFAKINSIPEG